MASDCLRLPPIGSSQVNLSSPDLTAFPNFAHVALREAVVGVGDLLYLPGWWWHQFEQPFEDSAALNLWARERDGAPTDRAQVDRRVRELSLSDHLEGAARQVAGANVGVALAALDRRRRAAAAGDARGLREGEGEGEGAVDHLNASLHAAADAWRDWAQAAAGGHPMAAMTATELVARFFAQGRYAEVIEQGMPASWRPGDGWDLSGIATLPRALRARCTRVDASKVSIFASVCA